MSSTQSQTPQSATQNQNRRKKVRAVMASGLVLGVGAAVTLAAWSDSVWGEGSFGSAGSDFNIQGYFSATEGWDEFISPDEAGTMEFGPASEALVPGVPVFQLVGLHEEKGDLGADITITQTALTTNPLTSQVAVTVADLGTSEAVPTSCSPTGTGMSFDSAGTLAAPAVLDTRVDKGGYQWLCIRAELNSDAGLDAAGVASQSALWHFDATSDDA